MKKLHIFTLLLLALFLASCPSVAQSDNTPSSPPDYEIYNADNAPPGSVVLDWSPEMMLSLKEISFPIVAMLWNGTPSGQWWQDAFCKYKQVGMMENGRVKMVLIPPADTIPESCLIKAGLVLTKDDIIPLKVAVLRLDLSMRNKISGDLAWEDICFYYCDNDGEAYLPWLNGYYQVKKGWSVAIFDELINDEYKLRHLCEILDEQGWEATPLPIF